MTADTEQPAIDPDQLAELEKRLHQAARDNRIACAAAFGIARSLGIPTAEVGRAADRLKIKISKCQLGCF